MSVKTTKRTSKKSETRSIENPQTSLANPDDWVYDGLIGGERSDTGVSVNQTTAMKYHAVWRAVNLLSKDISKTALHVFKYMENNSRARDKSHPYAALVGSNPNAEMTAYNFWYSILMHRLLNGNGYAYLFRDLMGNVTDMLILDSNCVYPARVNGSLHYVYDSRAANKAMVIDPKDILHFRGAAWDGINGYSVVQYARETFGMGIGAQKWEAKFFKNGAKVAVILEHPGKLDLAVQNRLRNSFNDLYSGIENSHKTAILEEGMTAKPLTINPKDAQVLELLSANVVAVANIYNLPIHKLGVAGSTSYASLEQENQRYLDDSLDPLMVEIEQELNSKMFTPKERMEYFIEFERKSWMRADIGTRSAFYVSATGGIPWMTVNEVRRTENMNPLDDQKYDTILLPTNNFDPEKTGAPEPIKEDEPRSSELLKPLQRILNDTATRMFNRGALQSDKAIKRGDSNEWLVTFRSESEPIVRDALSSVAESMAILGFGDSGLILEKWTDAVLDAVAQRCAALSSGKENAQIVTKRINQEMTANLLEIIK